MIVDASRLRELRKSHTRPPLTVFRFGWRRQFGGGRGVDRLAVAELLERMRPLVFELAKRVMHVMLDVGARIVVAAVAKARENVVPLRAPQIAASQQIAKVNAELHVERRL